MPKYTKKVWSNIKHVYFYKKFFYVNTSYDKELSSNIPEIMLKNKRIYLYSGKLRTLFKVRDEISGCKFGELVLTRKYRPAKYRKSKKKNKWGI